MTPRDLIVAIGDEVKEAVKTYVMNAENQPDKQVSVYVQHIPDEDFENDTYYPLVIVALTKVEDDTEYDAGEKDDMSVATVTLTFGVYGEEKDAWLDLLTLMQSVRKQLLQKRVVGDKQYRLLASAEWQTIEAQPYPFWFGYGTLKYSIPQPQEILADEFSGWSNFKNIKE